MSDALLGGLTPEAFLRRYWQKRPLLVRSAVADCKNLFSRAALVGLACRDDVESRLVLRERGRWSLSHGPFRAAHLRALPPRGWTLLVQGVNLHLAAGDALLRRFGFIPYARLDDLMVSVAAPGGGVGPHFDAYDVFLLQGSGRRRWRLSRQRDLALVPGRPLKILARFRPDAECTLAPGDMLYLPPGCAHDGVALDAGTTCSIGFRAPSAQELATGFLDWLRDDIALEGRYADPGLRPTREPALIGSAMRERCAEILRRLRWDRTRTDLFLGCHLTEPKPAVLFAPPRRPLTARAFAAAARRGVRLDQRTQLLYDDRSMFINGAAISRPRGASRALERLANARRLGAGDVPATAIGLLYGWYRDGCLHLA
ncbi:MAG TPA: cupin domain-containing protein [Casimicrobiaceae bacterium]|nr:cupin domain-containing protein [Casimicrobiaceae bacterium]